VTIFDFTLTVEGLDVLDDDVIDALFAAGCGDATIGQADGVPRATFHREAPGFSEAVSSAIRQVEAVAPGARVVAVTRAPESAASA